MYGDSFHPHGEDGLAMPVDVMQPLAMGHSVPRLCRSQFHAGFIKLVNAKAIQTQIIQGQVAGWFQSMGGRLINAMFSVAGFRGCYDDTRPLAR